VVEAYILIQTDVGKHHRSFPEVDQIQAVVTAEVVTGPFDVIARVAAEDVDVLAKLAVSKIQAVHGVTRTLTCFVVHL
jgi:DNA-binding Lrp family transcriptional regulator